MLRCAVFITSFVLLLFPAQLRAGQETQHLTYDVYASGFHVLQADLNMIVPENGHYDLEMSARTFGFLGKLVPWNGSFESRGWVVKDAPHYRPSLHKSTAMWRGESDSKEYKYNRDGSFQSLTITEHDKKPQIKTPEDALTNGTMDALSATLNVLQTVGAGNTCDGSYDIFDGKRRFTQTFLHKKNVKLETSRYNIFEGEAQVCAVEIEPVTGEWHKKPRGWLSIQEQGRQRGSLPTVWIGKLEEDGPAVPIKILIKTSYGSLFMHLAEYKFGDLIKTAEKREDR